MYTINTTKDVKDYRFTILIYLSNQILVNNLTNIKLKSDMTCFFWSIFLVFFLILKLKMLH